MNLYSRFLTILLTCQLSALLVGCQQTKQPSSLDSGKPLNTFYDYYIQHSPSMDRYSLLELAEFSKDADVIFIGEYHSHSASHKLQAELLSVLYAQRQQFVVSMEQFARNKQSTLNQYLSGEIGEQTLIRDGDAWGSYQSDYRSLVEFAREHNLPVIAANTPLSIVRCVARKGPESLKLLGEEHKSWVANDIKTSSFSYREKFMQAMGGHHPNNDKRVVKLGNSFFAQLARDNTMAESIYLAKKKFPNSQIIHINGAFHSNYHLGTVDALKRLAPELNVIVISPHFLDEAMEWDKGDFVYTIKPIPARYVKKHNRDKAISRMMSKRKQSRCELINE